jgi:hypothetical protein
MEVLAANWKILLGVLVAALWIVGVAGEKFYK